MPRLVFAETANEWNTGCGVAVEYFSKSLRTTKAAFTRPNFCTLFVPSLWVKIASFTRLIRSTCAQILVVSSSVNGLVLPTTHSANNNYYSYIYILINNHMGRLA